MTRPLSPRAAWMSFFAVLVLAVAMLVAVQAGQSEPAQLGVQAQKADAIPDRVQERYAPFRRAMTSQDRPPDPPKPEPRPGVEPTPASAGSPFGTNPALARRVRATPEGHMYLIAGRTGVCISSTTFVEEGCVSTEAALSGNTAQAVVCAPYLPTDRREVFGILPDGAVHVRVRMADGAERPVDVVNNAYLIRTQVPEPLPRTISWDDDAGHHEIDSTMPEDANSTRCASLEKLKAAAAGRR